jgi:cytochrome c553
MKRVRVGLGVLAVLALLGGAVIVLSAASTGDAAFLPGISGKDENPNGCVDCHKNADKDYRINAELAKVSGHPKIDKIVKTVPKDCAICHKAGGKVAELNIVMHKAHYSKPAENAFVTVYKGSCLHCHALDLNTGVMSVKGGPKNW